MIARRRLLFALGATALAPLQVLAQTQTRVFRIGVLDTQRREASPTYTAFLQGMRDLGYVEGKNLVMEERYADGQRRRLQEDAADLVRLKVDAIVVSSTPAGQAAQQATRTIPIVITATADPVADGFAKSLARPAGNITGMSTGAGITVTKHFELLKAAVPRLSRIGVLVNPANRAHPPQLKNVEAAAQRFGARVVTSEARAPEDLADALDRLARQHVDALILLRETLFNRRGRDIGGLALKYKLPSISAFEGYVESGGLMAYGDNTIERNRRAATQVDKILKGAKPGELPFEQPTKFYLAINRRTAQAIGLTIPQELLLQADRVIE